MAETVQSRQADALTREKPGLRPIADSGAKRSWTSSISESNMVNLTTVSGFAAKYMWTSGIRNNELGCEKKWIRTQRLCIGTRAERVRETSGDLVVDWTSHQEEREVGLVW